MVELLRPRAWALAACAALALVAVLAAACGGGGKKDEATETPTEEATASPTPGQNAGLKTPIPISPGEELHPEDLGARGTGLPGRGEFTGQRLVIPKIGVDAPFSYKVVPESGQMPNPDGPEDVAYYDFSAFPCCGGVPGKGGNIVVAGHVDYIRYGPAVFWRLHELAPGDIVEIRLADGSSARYEVQFNKRIIAGDDDWTPIVQATADESVTLITCTGEFEAGHYNQRQIVWARRV
jgi:LPXTG-site transpeptidase (sortase) family protein